MRFTIFPVALAVLGPRAALAGEAIVDLDYSFINDPIEAKGNTLSGSNDTVGIAARDMSMLNTSPLLDKRQLRCDTGFGYCSNFGRCCPDVRAGPCCSYGFCLDVGQACCPNGPCPAGQTCCGRNHCRPTDAVCCGDESWCERGNTCVKLSGYSYDVCCTNTRCTAYVTGGSTVTRTTTTSIRRTSTADDDSPTTTSRTGSSTNTYYFTITWTYWVYYWYYRVEIRASVVTSSITTTSSSVRVTAADSSAASASWSAISASVPTTTPEQTLSALAGSTSYLPGADPSSSGARGPEASGTSSTTSSARITGPTAIVGGGASGAGSVRVNTWLVMGLWAGIGGIVGVLMVAL